MSSPPARSFVVRLLSPVARFLPERLRLALNRAWSKRSTRGIGKWERKWKIVRSYRLKWYQHPFARARFILRDPEFDNFTYEIENEDELASFVAEALQTDRGEIADYVAEPGRDTDFITALCELLKERPDKKNRPHFGRRLGWYAIARALKPRWVVETGIHDGLGSALLLRALERNAADGIEGRLISIDIDPDCGWLVPGPMRSRWSRIIGSTFTALEPVVDGKEIGIVIHDSDHTYDCERFEFSTAVAQAAPTLALVSDNSHATSALRDVSDELGIEYRFFAERPKRHFYPGAGIGLSLLHQGEASPTPKRLDD